MKTTAALRLFPLAPELKVETQPKATLPIPCPKCGQKQTVLISKLRTDPKLTCPSCGHNFTVSVAFLSS